MHQTEVYIQHRFQPGDTIGTSITTRVVKSVYPVYLPDGSARLKYEFFPKPGFFLNNHDVSTVDQTYDLFPETCPECGRRTV